MFLGHLPRWLHAVAVSRRDLALPLDRLRARGQLREIRFPELRFSTEEAGDLLTRLAPSLVEEQVDVAVERADGWAASLQLAALGARTAAATDAPAATGVDDVALVQHYIVNEVLAAEDPEVVDALADLAVVDRVNPSLARALTGRQRRQRGAPPRRAARAVRVPLAVSRVVRDPRVGARRPDRRRRGTVARTAGRTARAGGAVVRGVRRARRRPRSLAPAPAARATPCACSPSRPASSTTVAAR